MFKSISLRRGVSLLVGLGATFSVGTWMPKPADALPLDRLLFNGVQLLQLSNLSAQQKVQLGQDIHQQVLSNYRLNRARNLNEYVNRVGQKLAAASNCSQYPFRFYVVDSSEINAFATTGGNVYVNTGLIRATDNEDQLAGVIAHEIAHICNDDVVNQMRETAIAQGIASLAGLDRSTIANLGYRVAIELPNSRQAEFKADANGLQYMTKAGYNPTAMPAFLSKLSRSSSPPTFLSSHPAARDRIAALNRQIAGR